MTTIEYDYDIEIDPLTFIIDEENVIITGMDRDGKKKTKITIPKESYFISAEILSKRETKEQQ